MATTPLTDEGKQLGDYLLYEGDRCYCRTAALITNKAGEAIAAGELSIGYPLNLNGTTWETLDDAAESSCDGVLLEVVGEAIADDAVSVKKYSILRNGPAIVNLDATPVPVTGGAFDLAALLTRLAALSPPIHVHREPTNQEEL